MTDYIPPADLVRTALKAAGFNARQVTARADGYRDVTVTIRDAMVSLKHVDAVVAPLCPPRDVHADGDTFTAASHAIAYLDSIVSPLADEIERRILAMPPRCIVTIRDGMQVSRDDGPTHGVAVTRWPDAPSGGRIGSRYCYGVRHAANRLAVELLTEQTTPAHGFPLAPIALPRPVPVATGPDRANWIACLDLDAA